MRSSKSSGGLCTDHHSVRGVPVSPDRGWKCLTRNVEKGPSRIVIVDDSVDTVPQMEILLKHFGYNIRERPATACMRSTSPGSRSRNSCCLISECRGSTATETASRLRREDWCEGSVLVAISGYGREVDRQRSREAGFDHHMLKPVDHHALVSLIATSTNRS